MPKKKNSKSFEPGEIVYFMSTGNSRSIAWHEGRIDHYDTPTDQYALLIDAIDKDGKRWHFSTLHSPDKLFKTKEELFHSCETYCREREAYWQGKAVEFSKLFIEEIKEK